MKKSGISTSRRQFIKQSSKIAAFTIIPRFVLGGKGYTTPSDQVTIGFIGTGKQSHGLTRGFLRLNGIRIVANADVDQQKKEAYAKLVNDHYAESSVKASYQGMDSYGDYKKITDGR